MGKPGTILVALFSGALLAALCACASSRDSASAGKGADRVGEGVPLPAASEVLKAATRFYGAQRSGTLDNWLLAQYPEHLRVPCFDRDGEALREGLDLSGGWHDAGDNVKFSLTTSWTVYALLKSYEAFPMAHGDFYGSAGGVEGAEPDGIPDVLNEARWGAEWLLKAHLDSSSLVTQVGDGADHRNPGTCATMSDLSPVSGGQPRTVWFGPSRDDPTRVKADQLGIAAAALALAGQIFRPYDSAFAAECVARAKQLYATALDRPGSTEEPPGQSFYSDRTWDDDLLCGGAELHRATKEKSYLDEAVAASRRLGDHGWVMDWAMHADLCRHTLAQAGGEAREEALSSWGRAVDRYLKSVSDAKETEGLAYFGEGGSLRLALNAAFSAALFSRTTGEKAPAEFAKRQWEWALGKNPYRRSFVVGIGENPPKSPHHKNAFGVDRWASPSDTSRYRLTGALVGGPHQREFKDPWMTSPPGYRDAMNDYVGNEVSIDYNAALVGATAFVVDEEAEASAASGN